jgi:hypothetical protein
MISRIEAFHYRCFDRLDLGAESYHVLAGQTAVGRAPYWIFLCWWAIL